MAKSKTEVSEPVEKKRRRQRKKKRLERKQLAARQKRLLVDAEDAVVALEHAQNRRSCTGSCRSRRCRPYRRLHDEIDKLPR